MSLATNISQSTGGPERLYDAFSSVAIAAGLLTALLHSNENYWSGQFFGWTTGLNGSFHRHATAAFGVGLAFYLWLTALALPIFLMTILSSRLTKIGRALHASAGLIVMAVPMVCLWFVECHQPGHVYEGGAWLRVEGSAAVACAVLYRCKRWPISIWATVTLLISHYLLWIHAYSVTFGYLGLWWLTVPVSAFVAVLMWGQYLKADHQT